MPDITQILKETMDQAKAMHDAISESDNANKETKELLGNILKTVPPAPNNGTQAQAINGDAGLTKPAGGAAVPLPNTGRFSPHDTPVLREKCAFENSALLTEHEYQWSVHIVGWTMAKMAIETGQWFAFADGEEDKKAKEIYLEATTSALKDMYPLFAPSFDAILEAVKNLRVETIDNAGPERDFAAVYAAYLSALPARIADLENTKAELGSKNIAGIDLHSKIIERTVKSVPKYLKSREEHAEVKSSLAEKVEVEAKRVYRWQF
ncbi:hypothetical protein QFC22_003411 [Naganishia vaughanmartiniae]|uniref:Uncharacterized protein n=1 Tax=Naganishia vaughanmartiniae TaxID=1424756 RepID=A0ACC2X8E2_9TREE|nr:hypothetical protein QFC22_003411 [Naganishia vaughanmartiniae]